MTNLFASCSNSAAAVDLIMGAIISNITILASGSRQPSKIICVAESKALFESMRLDDVDIARLRKPFERFDKKHRDTIKYSDLIFLLNYEEETPFNEKVVRTFDLDHSDKINFSEFSLVVWNYCTLDKANLGIQTMT